MSSLTELHTPRQTVNFSTLSKEQPLFKSVIRLNPVFQPILTSTIVTVNIGWNTLFSMVTDLNKGCSLLTVLKLNVRRGIWRYLRLDTDILIGTSVLNCQTLKTLFLQILVIKMIFSRKLGGIHYFLLYLWAKYELIWSDTTAQTVTLGANLLVKAQTIPQKANCVLFKKNQKLRYQIPHTGIG